MTTTKELVTAFYSRIENKDFDGVRALLHDDLDFQGPMQSAENANELVSMLTMMGGVTESFRIKQLFVEDDRACCVYDLVTATPIGPSPMAEYFEVRDGRIAAIHAHFDSRPWIALQGPEQK
ncbi:MAG: nuclear transport factor 2 family protein [Myxococcota bacterium]